MKLYGRSVAQLAALLRPNCPASTPLLAVQVRTRLEHGCKLRRGHRGPHVCPCGASWKRRRR